MIEYIQFMMVGILIIIGYIIFQQYQLVARIKCPDRNEKKKILINSKKESFNWKDQTYNIEPSCIYKTPGWVFKIDTIDYIKGEAAPIDYYAMEGEEVKRKFTPETVAETIFLLSKWRKYIQYVFYISIALIFIGVIQLFFSQQLMEAMGI